MGLPIILKYLARLAGSGSELYGKDALTACKVTTAASMPQARTCQTHGCFLHLSRTLFMSLGVVQVDEWLDRASQVVSGASFEPLCASINSYLSLRTFLVGYAPTVADVALWGQLQGKDFTRLHYH